MRSCSRCMGLVVLAVLTGVPLPVNAAGLPVVESVEHQPLVAATRRLVDALEILNLGDAQEGVVDGAAVVGRHGDTSARAR